MPWICHDFKHVLEFPEPLPPNVAGLGDLLLKTHMERAAFWLWVEPKARDDVCACVIRATGARGRQVRV